MWSFWSDFFSGDNVPSMPIRVELNISHWPLVGGDMDWFTTFGSPSAYRDQPLAESQNAYADPRRFFWATHSGH